MKLYVSAGAPNPRRVLFFAAEVGVADQLEPVELSLFEGAHRTDEYKALSPFSEVPALVLDTGAALTESRAICTYLQSLSHGPNLMGEDALERATIEMWDRRMELRLFGPGAMAVRHSFPAFSVLESQLPDYAEACLARLKSMCDWLNGYLSDRAWIAADRITIADITALVGLDFARIVKFRTPEEDYPHLARWRAAMSERPAATLGMLKR